MLAQLMEDQRLLKRPVGAQPTAFGALRPPQTLAQPMEDRQLLKRPAARQCWSSWIGKRNRDFYCDAGRHRNRDRNSDERQHSFLGAANANSAATTINGNAAQALSSCHRHQVGRPRQPHRPISEISNRFNLRPQAPLRGDYYSGQCNRTGRWCRFSFQPDRCRAEFFGR